MSAIPGSIPTSTISMPKHFLETPLMHQSLPLNEPNRSHSRSYKGTQLYGRMSSNILRKHNITLDELSHDEGYRVYYIIFCKIRMLLIILGLWAPPDKGFCYWCLRYMYPAFIYFLILYPWTTFLTQSAYWTVPMFLFINLHLSGVFAYRAARQYWNSEKNHLINFITSTFIPFYHDYSQFERTYSSHQLTDKRDTPSFTGIEHYNDRGDYNHYMTQKSLQMGFQQRYKNENRKRQRNAYKYEINYNDNAKRKHKKINGIRQDAQFDILEDIRKHTSDPFKQKEENISSWSNIAGTENKLSLTLFYEATQRLWRRFWVLTLLTTLPIVIILLIEIMSPTLHSSITVHSSIKSPIFGDIYIPLNTVVTFARIFYHIAEFVFMSLYFQFICECHRGDLVIHLHYYDTSDINDKEKHLLSSYKSMLSYYNELEHRLASIIWDWDRIAASTRDTSRAFRWWILTMVSCNFIAGVTAIVNLSKQSLDGFPQHLEMYLPAIVNLFISFYVLFSGTKISHMNKAVRRRTYFLLASTHFAHIEVDHESKIDIYINNEHEQNVHACDMEQISTIEPSVQSVELQVRKQNVYIQAQTVARAATTREIGISVYGMVLNRNLFLAFFSPFVAFFLFCINTWLPAT